MSKRVLLFLLGLAGVLSWVELALLVTNTSPDLLVSRLAFFGLVFIGTWSSSAVVAYWLAMHFSAQRVVRSDLPRAMLQGLPLAALLAVAAFLQSIHALSPVIALLLLVFTGLAEFVLMPKEGVRVPKPRILKRLPHQVTAVAHRRAHPAGKASSAKPTTASTPPVEEPNPKIIELSKVRAKKTKIQSRDSEWKSNN